jgi:hypothetical protein
VAVAKNPPVTGECRLCKTVTELRESHIVSKFLLRESQVIGNKKKFDIVCYSNPEHTERHKQDGIKEHLFCDECETKRLAPLEGYARETFYGPTGPFERKHTDGFLWTGLNYAKMKLFTTSILWRMSLSTHQFYAAVELGERHQERIRQMLLNGDPKEDWRYGCAVAYLLYGGKPMGGVFSQPQAFSTTGAKAAYRFMMAGMVWFFYVTSHPLHDQAEVGFLQPSGKWLILTMEAFQFPFIKEEMDAYRKHSKS